MFRELINYASENCSEIRRQIWGKRLLCTGKTMLHEAWLGRAQSFTTPVLLFLYVSPRGEPDVSNWSDRDRFPVNVEVHSKRRDDSKQRGKQQKTALLTIVSGKNAGPRQFQRRCNAKTTRIKRRKKKGGNQLVRLPCLLSWRWGKVPLLQLGRLYADGTTVIDRTRKAGNLQVPFSLAKKI